MAGRSISISSILLSYFLVAGGLVLGIVLFAQLGGESDALFYATLGIGGLAGGFVAARGSRHATVIEPAIGGLLVIASVVAVFVGTNIGSFLWNVAKDDVVKTVGLSGGVAAAGALLGAVVAEKTVAGYAQSSLEWLLLVAFTMMGACIVAFLVTGGVAARGATDDDTLGGVYLGAMVGGALLGGLAIGASAPRRMLLVTFLGSVAGLMGLYLAMATLPNVKNDDSAAGGFAIIGVFAGLIAIVGAAIGWRVVGKRSAGALAAQSRAFE